MLVPHVALQAPKCWNMLHVDRFPKCWKNMFNMVGDPQHAYGVRRPGAYSLGDQLGPERGPKSKIGDGSDLGTLHTQVTSVGDFRLHACVELQLIPRFSTFLGLADLQQNDREIA